MNHDLRVFMALMTHAREHGFPDSWITERYRAATGQMPPKKWFKSNARQAHKKQAPSPSRQVKVLDDARESRAIKAHHWRQLNAFRPVDLLD